MRNSISRGFTLIELLTVIAIIAVLAALLFPVFSRAKEAARQGTCISNMQKIQVALTQYFQDNSDNYPPLLLGFAERPDGLPWAPGDPGPVPANRIQHGFLYPFYLKSIDDFHCPDNTKKDMSLTTTAIFPPSSALNPLVPTVGFYGIDVPPAFQTRTAYFYQFDSYDISSFLQPDGTANGFQIVYSRDWTGVRGTADSPNQLKYRNPPQDRTVATWCNYHTSVAGADKTPIATLAGKPAPRDYKIVIQKGWNTAN